MPTLTARLFMNGRSQAVRLPAECRFEGDTVYVSRDERTGDVTLSARPPLSAYENFAALREQLGPIPELTHWLDERPLNAPGGLRDPFADWSEEAVIGAAVAQPGKQA